MINYEDDPQRGPPDIKNSGNNIEFSTGAKREDKSEKARIDLLPGDALWEIGKHYAAGGKLHGDRNWEKGIPLSSYIQGMHRHMLQLAAGMTDEPHALSLAWNVLGYIATKKRIDNGLLPKELDDQHTPYKDADDTDW